MHRHRLCHAHYNLNPKLFRQSIGLNLKLHVLFSKLPNLHMSVRHGPEHLISNLVGFPWDSVDADEQDRRKFRGPIVFQNSQLARADFDPLVLLLDIGCSSSGCCGFNVGAVVFLAFVVVVASSAYASLASSSFAMGSSRVSPDIAKARVVSARSFSSLQPFNSLLIACRDAERCY